MSMSSDVCYLFLFSCIHFDVFFLSILANDQPIVYLSSWLNKESSEFLNILQNVGSGDAFTHTDNCSLYIPAQRSLIRFVLMETGFYEGSSLSLV